MIARISDSTSTASRFGRQARRPQDEAPVERVQHRRHDGQLDRILERREGPAEGVRKRGRFDVADRDQLELAQQQRHEAEKEHRVHQARPPLAAAPCGSAARR
jgi:hypothetical protein